MKIRQSFHVNARDNPKNISSPPISRPHFSRASTAAKFSYPKGLEKFDFLKFR